MDAEPSVAIPIALITTHLIGLGIWYFKKLHAVEQAVSGKADTHTLNQVVEAMRRRNDENADRIIQSMTQLEARVTDRQQELLTMLIKDARESKR